MYFADICKELQSYRRIALLRLCKLLMSHRATPLCASCCSTVLFPITGMYL